VNRAVLVLVLALGGCNSGSATPAPPPRVAPAPAGSASAIGEVSRLEAQPLYRALCQPCHGADAKGYAADHAPSLINPTFLESASDEFLRRSIAEGRPGTSMAAYGKVRGGPLDNAGVDRLVTYLRGQGPAARPLPPAQPGNAATGAAIYARRCLSCHGDAMTRGEAVGLANSGFLAMASDAFLRHAIVHGRPGTKMEAFGQALSDPEIDGVVAFVRTLGRGASAVQLLPEPTGKEPPVLNPSGRTPRFTLRADPCPTVAGGSAAAAGCKPDPRYVPVEQVAAALAARQRIVIIDARPPSEWRRVHIAGAVSIPYHDLTRLDELPRDGTWIVAYCACPHHLSGIVVDELRKRGYAHSAVLDEGINDWHRRGFPVVAAEGVARPPGEPKGVPAAAASAR
jgi:cytochrome c oxidase cbb3-type subunit 3